MAEELKNFPKGSCYCCVYGIAEPVEEGFRLYPHRPWQYEGDAWLYVEGLAVTGPAVVGLSYDAEKDLWGYQNVSYDPSPEPPGVWRGVDKESRRAWWRPIERKTLWELIEPV